MDSVEAGLQFVLGLAGARAGILYVPGEDGTARALADRRGRSPALRVAAESLWRLAKAGKRGELLAPPVVAWCAGDPLAGMICLELEPGRVVDALRLGAVATGLIELATTEAVTLNPVRESLGLIHQAADPAVTLLRLLAEVEWNVAALARRLHCRRASIYAVARKYGVTLVRRC